MKTYTAEEAAAVLKLNKVYLRTLCRDGELQGFKTGRKWIITEESMIDFLNSRTKIYEDSKRL